MIDFDEGYTSSIKSVAIEKSSKINLATQFLNGKMLMFSKVSIKSFVYDLIVYVFMFPNQEIQEIYQEYQINRCYLYKNLTDTDSTSMFFVFIYDLNSCVSKDKSRNIIFDVMIKSKIFDRLDLSAEIYEQFNCRNEALKKRVGLFETESIDRPNVITIILNPKEYYEHFVNHSDNKNRKGLKKSTFRMDFGSDSNCLSDLTEFMNEFLSKPNKVEKIEQKRFQVINKSMQMKSVSKVQFGQLNDKRFYFSNGIMPLPFGHPYLEELRKEKHKYRHIHKIIQQKNTIF